MRKLLIATLLLSSSAFADPITGVQGFDYKAYRHSNVPNNLASLKAGASSHLSCDDLGFTTNYGTVWNNVKNIADNVMSNKQTLLLGASQYLLAKASPTLYSVLSRLNSLAQLGLKYNFDACALYKKAQQEADKSSNQEGLSGLCMSVVGDPEVCTAPGKALKAVFGKGQVDVVDQIVKDPQTADLVKAVAGTVVFTAEGDGMETDFYAPSWHTADIYTGFYGEYYQKYAEIAEKVHNRNLTEDQYHARYNPWITVGGEINLKKVTAHNGWIDLSHAKYGGYQIPYRFFYEVSAFPPEVAAVYIRKLAQYAAMIDLQSFLSAVEKALSTQAGRTGKAGILKNKTLINNVKQSYEQFTSNFGTAGKQDILALQSSVEARHAKLMSAMTSSPSTEVEKSYTEDLEDLMVGPEKPRPDQLIKPK